MKLKALLVAGIATLAIPASAEATTDTNKLVTHLGVQSGQAYLNFSTTIPNSTANNLSTACSGNNVYIDTTSDFGKSLLAIALAARQNNLMLNRIDYTQNASGNCLASLIEI